MKHANELKRFLSQLLDAADLYGSVEAIETERRPGFIPHSWNKGGFELRAFTTLGHLQGSSEHGNTYAEALIDYQIEQAEKFHAECEKVDLDNLTDLQFDDLYEYLCDTDSNSVMFQATLMFTSEKTLDVNMYLETSDAPYHRGYDYKFESELTFSDLADLKRQLRLFVPQAKQFFMLEPSKQGTFGKCENRSIYQHTIRKPLSEIEEA